jgi:Tfp pilus assembly protein PilF
MKTLVSSVVLFTGLCGFSLAGFAEQDNYQVQLIANGKLVEAEQGLLVMLEKDPNDPYALLNLAYVYQKSGDQEKARQVYQRILEQRQNPYAELKSGKPEAVKSIARRGIAQLEKQ